ncbi:hypothetical protein ACFWYW_46645 [Nonomuraea sp. NPDC059023]|uniref:hypothetical protein n=1 Tax=unclassified Nonomuraea TaxID=2593643 RepID=UPI0036BB6DA6
MWNYLQLEMAGEFGQPIIGPGGMTKAQAHSEIRGLLDRLAADQPHLFERAARTWRDGAQDDTVAVELPQDAIVVWALYECPEAQSPEAAATAWVKNYANIMREAGGPDATVAEPSDDPVLAAATRVAGHVRELRTRYPSALAQMKQFAGERGQSASLDWPEWCWLPMGAAHAIVTSGGRSAFSNPADIGRVAAVAHWKLVDRAIVMPSEAVASEAVPGPTPDIRETDLAIPREQLLSELAGACYYLVIPQSRPDDHTGPWLYGTYIHLEWDMNVRRSELRLLLDLGQGWDTLIPISVHADQPTLAWSAKDMEASASGILGAAAQGSAADVQRWGAWMAWPLVGALLDERALLIGPRTLDDPNLDLMVRGSRAWELTYDRPRPTAVP